MRRSLALALLLIAFTALSAAMSTGFAQDAPKADAARGKKALFERAYVPAGWTKSNYENVWKLWTPAPKEKPADYAAALGERYGLSPAPYENAGLPMGLRPGNTAIGLPGIANDCMLCHGGSIMGKSIVGLGNASLEVQSLFEELGQAAGASPKLLPFTFGRVRGTSEAGAMAVYLLSFREPNLDLTFKRHDLGLRDDLCEDPPAWWLLKRKKTMYHTGTSDARSVRSIMQFMLSPTNSKAVFHREEPTFADIQAYILSIDAPKYPLTIDQKLAGRGRPIYMKSCARCHGDEQTYPNKIVAIDTIGTDRNRFEGFSSRVGAHYNKSWFAKETGDGYRAAEPEGYQAPPLDGVWATAPYFHNASVPTLAAVLDSKSRPKIFTRSYRTAQEDFDADNVGWKVQLVDRPDDSLPPHERRKIYDTTQPGRGNQGHTFGDHLSADERRAVIEYLKTR